MPRRTRAHAARGTRRRRRRRTRAPPHGAWMAAHRRRARRAAATTGAARTHLNARHTRGARCHPHCEWRAPKNTERGPIIPDRRRAHRRGHRSLPLTKNLQTISTRRNQSTCERESYCISARTDGNTLARGSPPVRPNGIAAATFYSGGRARLPPFPSSSSSVSSGRE